MALGFALMRWYTRLLVVICWVKGHRWEGWTVGGPYCSRCFAGWHRARGAVRPRV